MDYKELEIFASKYAESWCSQNPESVAAFFSGKGSLSVNDDTADKGRAAIAKVAEGFMNAFPDMTVTKDSL
ncbi:MAG TPA: hypothetical protein PKC91_02735 [Ignavibacteria bacterium]|nr:hypothetical protein [Ignavibacteria bacterium]